MRATRTIALLALALASVAPARAQDLDQLVESPGHTLGPHRWRTQPHVVGAPDGETKLVVFVPARVGGGLLPGPRPGVVFVPGHGRQVRPRAYRQLGRYLNSHGFYVAMFDFPDKGHASAPDDWRGRYELALAQLELEAQTPGRFLHGRIDLDRLALGGHSFGGAFAVEEAARDGTGRYKAVFLFASGSNYDRGFLDDARRITAPTIAFGGTYDFSAPPLENDRRVVERVASAEKAFVLVERGNHMNAPTDYDTPLVGRIVWRPRTVWLGVFPTFAGFEPVFEPDPSKTAISGPEQKGITFPLLAAWLDRHLRAGSDVDGWLSTRLQRLGDLGLLAAETWIEPAPPAAGIVGALAGGGSPP
jgi:dienelactone hydrolase